MSDDKEIWKDCKGYEGRYQVSNFGRVWSVLKQQYKSQRPNRDGYLRVTLVSKNGKMRAETVHRLVALAFVDKPDGCTVVNHIDSDRQNNYAGNLEWTTVQGNTKHRYDYGHVSEAQKKATEAAKYINTKIYTVYQNGVLIGEYKGLLAAACNANVDPKTISLCIKEKRSTRKRLTFEKRGGACP